MPCISPVDVFVRSVQTTIKVPCGRCLNCRLARSNSLSFAAEAELQSVYAAGLGASFVTLTYAPEFLPPGASLVKADLQKYIKRLRINVDRAFNKQVRSKYIACGEYGDSFGRPHYHIVFLGYSVEIVNTYADKWSFGLSKVLPLKPGGIRYVTKYCMKQTYGRLKDDMYTSKGLESPFIVHSVNLGDKYFRDNLEDISTHNFSLVRRGVRITMPSYFRKKYDVHKQFNVSKVLLDLKKQSDFEGFDSIDAWQKNVAYLREREIAGNLRSNGVAVDYNYCNSLLLDKDSVTDLVRSI